jgi:hypothetical protein
VQQKKLKTIRGSYIGLDLSIHYKKRPKKSGETLPLQRSLLFTYLYIQDRMLAIFLCILYMENWQLSLVKMIKAFK